MVFQNQKTSLQYHKQRSEHWIIIAGRGQAVCGNRNISITPGSHIFVEKNTVHRLENNKSENLIIIEVQTGDYLEEDDIVRLQDEYGRI